MQTIGKFTFFFTEKDPFSNWYLRDFIVKGIVFNCMEQYMMYAKAKLFGDEDTATMILTTKYQKEQKRLGRLVKNYVDEIWVARRERIVCAGACEKFRQHQDLKDMLLSTNGTCLVEASPYDKIWGAGLSASDPRILDRSQWPGMNLLGEVLMNVRILLSEKE